MLSGKTSAGNLLIAAGATSGTGTAILDTLDMMTKYSVALGLLVSICGVLGGLFLNFYFKNKELKEMRRHNRAIEDSRQ